MVMNAHLVPEAALVRQESMSAAEIIRALSAGQYVLPDADPKTLATQRHDFLDEADAALQEGLHRNAACSCCPSGTEPVR